MTAKRSLARLRKRGIAGRAAIPLDSLASVGSEPLRFGVLTSEAGHGFSLVFQREKPDNQSLGSECGLRPRLDSASPLAETSGGALLLFLLPHRFQGCFGQLRRNRKTARPSKLAEFACKCNWRHQRNRAIKFLSVLWTYAFLNGSRFSHPLHYHVNRRLRISIFRQIPTQLLKVSLHPVRLQITGPRTYEDVPNFICQIRVSKKVSSLNAGLDFNSFILTQRSQRFEGLADHHDSLLCFQLLLQKVRQLISRMFISFAIIRGRSHV